MDNVLIGIDVSSAQGHIDWDTVTASGEANYVFCKATEGMTFVDPTFKTNWEATKAHDFVRGAYHFARLNGNAIAEADFFMKTVGNLDLTDMLVLDIETSNITGNQFTDWTLTWLERVEQYSGRTPICYTGGPFFTSHIIGFNTDTAVRLAKFPLWLAAYTNHPDKFIPPIWKDLGWTFWQRSGDQSAIGDTILHVPGIRGNVDRNVFKGTLDDLKTFAINLHTGTNNSFTTTVDAIADLSRI